MPLFRAAVNYFVHDCEQNEKEILRAMNKLLRNFLQFEWRGEGK